jgi:hypothetical protein
LSANRNCVLACKIKINQIIKKLYYLSYDVDADTADLSKHDFLGRCECDLAEIVAATNGVHYLPIKSKISYFHFKNIILK